MFQRVMLLMELCRIFYFSDCSHVLLMQGLPFPAAHVIEVCKRIVLEQMSMFANSVGRKCASMCPLYGDVPMGPPGPVGLPGPSGEEVSIQEEKNKAISEN